MIYYGGAVTTDPNTGCEVYGPGRQDGFEETLIPHSGSANLICGPLIFVLSPR
jgi:hypothetical protein